MRFGVASRIQSKPLAIPADVSGSRLLVTPFKPDQRWASTTRGQLTTGESGSPPRGGDPYGLASEAALHGFELIPYCAGMKLAAKSLKCD
jgi:hypothetical protein